MLAPPFCSTMYESGCIQSTYGMQPSNSHHGSIGLHPSGSCSMIKDYTQSYRSGFSNIPHRDKHNLSDATERNSCSKWTEEKSKTQLRKPNRNSSKYPDMTFDESYDEEADEVFSDEDCMEMDERGFTLYASKQPTDGGVVINGDNITGQLLKFADMVNSDIYKFFGRRKADEDSCDIYEEKWTIGKTGRELYYADLMRIAQGVEDMDDNKSSATCKSDNSNSPKCDNVHTYSGKADKHLGLGPLEELFIRPKSKDSSKIKKSHRCNTSEYPVLPFGKRKLPESFWQEPEKCKTQSKTRIIINRHIKRGKSSGTIHIGGTTTPDFSDLLESWTGDENTGEVSSSDDVSSSASESGSKYHTRKVDRENSV